MRCAVRVAVPAAVVLVLIRVASRRPPAVAGTTAAEADGPGTYLVTRVDKTTRDDREVTLEAASRAARR